ncbi:MAG: restriction endonuclease [Cetobacterium sp.]|uniref:restriction endonuclease n=1 Tax=Cetobacterium sp. TaxID=2071632 RepID=UPI002FCC6F10
MLFNLKKLLTINDLISEANLFSINFSLTNHPELYGINDGKKIGTFVEHAFKKFLENKYIFMSGNSARGIDIPDPLINTDIKVTSIQQPQSSCPFKSARQKIFGLGYNLIIFVYEKQDDSSTRTSRLQIKYCTFVESKHTADYTLTRMLNSLKDGGANKEDIIGHFENINLPGDEIIYSELADEVLEKTIYQGYLTISNALQWRLQYSRVINLNNQVLGVKNYIW